MTVIGVLLNGVTWSGVLASVSKQEPLALQLRGICDTDSPSQWVGNDNLRIAAFMFMNANTVYANLHIA